MRFESYFNAADSKGAESTPQGAAKVTGRAQPLRQLASSLPNTAMRQPKHVQIIRDELPSVRASSPASRLSKTGSSDT